jgi:hypothetical protein
MTQALYAHMNKKKKLKDNYQNNVALGSPEDYMS